MMRSRVIARSMRQRKEEGGTEHLLPARGSGAPCQQGKRGCPSNPESKECCRCGKRAEVCRGWAVARGERWAAHL